MFYNILYYVSSQENNILSEEQISLLVYVILILVLFVSIFILFFTAFQKRKNKLLFDKIKQQQEFDEEISKTQTEIQEQTLKHIGWELHDNVGQLLAYATMQLNMLSTQVSNDIKGKVDEATDVIKESLKEVRSLSKSLNNDVILNIGFEQSISNELDRLKRMKFASAELHIEGDAQALENKKHEIIMFRILQEFLSNSVKYSEAKNLLVKLNYQNNHLTITASDDGKGFDLTTVNKGSGLINMRSRAELINAVFELDSKPDDGVKMTIVYPFH